MQMMRMWAGDDAAEESEGELMGKLTLAEPNILATT